MLRKLLRLASSLARFGKLLTSFDVLERKISQRFAMPIERSIEVYTRCGEHLVATLSSKIGIVPGIGDARRNQRFGHRSELILFHIPLRGLVFQRPSISEISLWVRRIVDWVPYRYHFT